MKFMAKSTLHCIRSLALANKVYFSCVVSYNSNTLALGVHGKTMSLSGLSSETNHLFMLHKKLQKHSGHILDLNECNNQVENLYLIHSVMC